MDERETPLEREHSLQVVLPGGLERNVTVHGSQPVMDLLVTLCASYRLNPSDYTVEFLSPNKNDISFKPNSPIGSLEAEKMVLKPKGAEEKVKRPYMPEVTVRLLINYNKSYKAVVRVNPRVPLEMLLPVVCDKCELREETTVLLRDGESWEPLDISKSLNELGLREVFAKDTAAREPEDCQQRASTPDIVVTPTKVISPPPPQDLPKKKKKQKENLWFLSLFRRRKKKTQMEGAVSAPASPGLNKQRAGSSDCLDASSPDALKADMLKKRRAPQPPIGASQSVPASLSSCHVGEAQKPEDTTIRRTKRKAPPPPSMKSHQEMPTDTAEEGTVGSLDDLRDSDGSDSVTVSLSSSSSPHPSPSSSSSSSPSLSSVHKASDRIPPPVQVKNSSDARCALAKVLTSSISKGTLVRRLRSSRLSDGSSSVSQRGPNYGSALSAELTSVPDRGPPAEQEWEDLAQRRGLTTFKVVPSKATQPQDQQLCPDPLENMLDHGRTEGDPCSPDRLTTPSPQPEPEADSEEVEASDGPASPPPSHDSDCQDGAGPPPSEAGDSSVKQTTEEPEVPSEETQTVLGDCRGVGLTGEESAVSSEETPAAPADCRDEEPEVSSEENPVVPADCGDEDLTEVSLTTSEGQSEFLPSPSESPDTDVDQAGLCAAENKDEMSPLNEDAFPPPPPPVFYHEASEDQESAREDPAASSQPPSDQIEVVGGDVEAKATSSVPSRFAQAVALAVQRSRLQSPSKAALPQNPAGPSSTLPSASRSTYQYGA